MAIENLGNGALDLGGRDPVLAINRENAEGVN